MKILLGMAFLCDNTDTAFFGIRTDGSRYWQAYQSHAYPFYPVLVSIDEFSHSLFEFLQQRASQGYVGDDSSWLALLFAVLACGVQFSDDPIQERELRTKVFRTCSHRDT